MKIAIPNKQNLPHVVRTAFEAVTASISEAFRVQHHDSGMHSFGTMPSEGRAEVTGAVITSGEGSPDGVVPGSIGDLYLRTDGGASTTLYVKTTGINTRNGWTAK